MQQYQCKCHLTGTICGGCAASLDLRESELALENFNEEEAAITIREAGLDVCAQTMRSGELAGVANVSRSGL